LKTIAHISDLHFGRTEPRVVEALLAELEATAPTVIAVSGDLTQDARRAEFISARAFLDRLPAPYVVVPGNHDIPRHNLARRFLTPFRRYRRYIAEDTAPLLIQDGMALAGVNTARRLVAHWNWSHGAIGRAQILAVGARMRALPRDMLKVVVAHHPFLPPPDRPMQTLVRRAEVAMRYFAACGVDLVLTGHLHRAFSGDVSLHHTRVRRPVLVAQASTATSTRLRNESNAYNSIMIDGPRLHLRLKRWNGQSFETADEAVFEKIRGRWVSV
jgi:3',5'-cyclic AMP phosphodiesterase CpdA